MSFADTKSNDDMVKTLYSSYGHFAVALYNISIKHELSIPTLFVNLPVDWIKLFFKYVNNLVRRVYGTANSKLKKDSYNINDQVNSNSKDKDKDIRDKEELTSKN